MVEVLVPLSAFALTFGMWYIFITARNKERLALIEKGGSPDLFKINSGFRSLKLGLFLVGVAIGIIAGYYLKEGGMDETPAFFSMIFLFGGIALVVTHFLEKKNKEN
jgi:predicted MFS family arabinose efflux permease